MKENQKQRHQQKNKHNQQEHRKVDQNHDKKTQVLIAQETFNH